MTDLFDPAGLGDADLRDADLRTALTAASGAEPDLARARTSWHRRVVRARRRRAAAASLGGTAVLVLGAVGIGAFGPSTSERIAGGSTAVSVGIDPTGVDASGSNGSSGPSGSAGSAGGSAAATSAGMDAPDDTMPADAEVVRSIAVTGRQELAYTGVGGTIQVIADLDGLELASFPALPGFEVESTRVADAEIVVVFVSDTHRTKLRARLVEGRLVIDRSEEPRGGTSTQPVPADPPAGPPITPPGATVSTPAGGTTGVGNGAGNGNGNGTTPSLPVTPGNPVTPTQPPTANSGNPNGNNGNANNGTNGNNGTGTTAPTGPTTTVAAPGNANNGNANNGNANNGNANNGNASNGNANNGNASNGNASNGNANNGNGG